MNPKFVPQVVIIAGSDTDLKAIEDAGMLKAFQEMSITYALSFLSAHRHPDDLKNYLLAMEKEGTLVFIGIAGMSAALPGDMSAILKNKRPVIGVPLIAPDGFSGLDALFSMIRLPASTAVAVPGIGKAGLKNATILACQILGVERPETQVALNNYLTKKAAKKPPQPDFEIFNGKTVHHQHKGGA
ncbi:MAG: AIR carboxylase family protein [Patescibacteria group bacterium]|nr:AIR carboxylase family protein [Patescibacteria group bacterium]MDD4611103.1 AIR carboxylase family protein [Patescibacteria group bacterium]